MALAAATPEVVAPVANMLEAALAAGPLTSGARESPAKGPHGEQNTHEHKRNNTHEHKRKGATCESRLSHF